MMRSAIMIGLCAAACGGGKKSDTTPDGVTINNTSGDTTDRSASMVTPETVDEINRMLVRKRPAVSRCLTMIVDAKELPKNSRGRMTLGIAIAPSGQPTVKVLKASLESKALEDCVVAKVTEIEFPELPSAYETTYTYSFEAIQ